MARIVKKIKLYQNLSAKQLNNFLLPLGTNLDVERLVEIKRKEEDLFGDFIVVGGYKFKFASGSYVCMETPTDKHVKQTVHAFKAPNDHYKR